MAAELKKARRKSRQPGAVDHHHQPLAKRQQSNDQANQKDANADLTFCVFYRSFRAHILVTAGITV